MTHVDTPPPPPVASAYTPPPPVAAPAQSGSPARTIALSVLLVFLVLIVIPIMALRVLGTKVDDASLYPIELVETPADAEPYLARDSSFTIGTDPSWGEPSIEPNSVTGRDTVFWLVPEYASSDFLTNVNVSSVVVSPGTTLEMMSASELANARTQLDDVAGIEERTRNIGGVLVREFSFTGSVQGVDLDWYAVIHKDGSLVHMATVTAPTEFADEVRAESEPYLLSLRSLN